jgi:hypothetical protein
MHCMERINERTQSLMTQMVAPTTCPLMRPRRVRIPIKATAREPTRRPDTYQRVPQSRTSSVAKCSRSIHWVIFDVAQASRNGLV